MSSKLEELQRRQEEFIQACGWERFHRPKSIAMALSVESSELVELFQWHDNLPPSAYRDHPDLVGDVREELPDVMIYTLSMAAALDIDLEQAVNEKMDDNFERFDGESAMEIREDLDQWIDRSGQ